MQGAAARLRVRLRGSAGRVLSPTGEVGENIVSQSYRQIVNRFGAPLKTFAGTGGELCAYYDVVGEATGWVFCFKHGAMVSASGNQRRPAGVR